MKQLISVPSMLEDLPSVSVCIPARNETHAMTQSLERVIASTYPKLEMIVLDDSSVDNTSILIKSFAHAGVRFVEGSPLPDGWLGKNHALQGLLEQASGTYVLFMDIDTHISPDTIGQLVSYALQESADMVSVMPRRENALRASALLATMRHFWSVVLHRPSAPAVAGNAWMIRRTVLQNDMNGFEDLRMGVQPEVSLAARLAKNDAYRFIISTPLLGLSYEKKWSSQIETGIRLLYPLFGGRAMYGWAALALISLTLVPLGLLVASQFVELSVYIIVISTLLATVWIGLYSAYLYQIWTKKWLLGALIVPYTVLQELIILALSMVRYARHTVTWKGRPITARARSVSR